MSCSTGRGPYSGGFVGSVWTPTPRLILQTWRCDSAGSWQHSGTSRSREPRLRCAHTLCSDRGEVRSDIRALAAAGIVDEAPAVAVWDGALAAPSGHLPTWVHGDLFPMNLLVDGGALSAVIDFDLMGAGDSAVDMVPAWTSLTAETRPLFREASGVDDDTWVRGRGWALKAGLGAVRRYGTGGHPHAVVGRYALSQTIADHR